MSNANALTINSASLPGQEEGELGELGELGATAQQ